MLRGICNVSAQPSCIVIGQRGMHYVMMIFGLAENAILCSVTSEAEDCTSVHECV
jgi:hypothetical protein